MKKFTKQFVVAGSILGLAVSSYAVPTIRVSDGLGNSVEIADGGSATIVGSATATTGGDLSGLAGVVQFSGTVGAWTLNVDTGSSKPFIGTAVKPYMDLHFLASGGVGTLTISFSDDGFGPTTGGFSAHVGGTTDGSVSYDTKLSAANTLFAGASLTSQGPFGPVSFSGDTTGAGTSANPYALTQIISITHSSSGQLTSGDAVLKVPEGGATLILLGSGLTALGAFRRKVARN